MSGPRTGRLGPLLAFGFWLIAFLPPAVSAGQTIDPDTVRRGRFDYGKMWTFEYPPAEYFTTTYGFDASPAWFDNARLAALRIPGCSASFVSPNGLVVTNHHCARSAVSRVTREGEHLLDDGFYAASLDDERPIPGYWADQLVAVEDVSDEVFAAVDAAPSDARDQARDDAIRAIQTRLRQAQPEPVMVQVVPLYDGGRYSAYVFRRFRDVRLVAAAELEMGFFGGDADNFTYPRYALDFAFYRIYDDDGTPYRPQHWFTWGDGVHEGDPVFVIGNPGPTNRLKTVAQLRYQRDVLVPVRKAYYQGRLQALRDAYEADPVAGEALDLRNQAFSLSNSLKAYTGRLEALQDPAIMVRKEAAETELEAALADDAELSAAYGDLIPRLASLQQELAGLRGPYGAFYRLANLSYGSRTLARASMALELERMRERGADADSLQAARDRLSGMPDHPADLEEDLLAIRFRDFAHYLGADDEVTRLALEGRSAEGAATALLATSVFSSKAGTDAALEAGPLPPDDPALALARVLEGRVAAYDTRTRELGRAEAELEARLGRARFQVYGTSVPPDATSSPRITDGVVKGYEYNGTLAPAHTTMFGIYDRHFSFEANVDWALPDRWLPPPEGLDLSTPLDFVSTADTYGGNSGSPAVTPDLAIVGLNFDRNIQGLSRDFIYLPERGRNVMVDVRAIREALDVVYDADRIVLEILTGTLAPSEAEADAILETGGTGR